MFCSRALLASLIATVWLLAPLDAVAQPASTVRLKTSGIRGTLAANGDAVTLADTGGLAGISIQTLDSYSGTWEVQCSTDNGVTFDADDEVVIVLMGDTTGAGVVSVTDVVGIWQGNISGCNAVKVIATAGFAASDTAVQIQAITPGGGSGGGGGGGSGDTELPAVETPGDDLTNATQAPRVIALMHCFDGTTWDRCQTTRDPCDGAAKTVIPINISTATTTELTPALAGASTNYYVCSLVLVAGAAQTIAIVDDDSDGCGSVTAGMAGGTTAAAGFSFAANGGLTLGNGQGTVMKTNGTNRVICAVTGQATLVVGTMSVVAAP